MVFETVFLRAILLLAKGTRTYTQGCGALVAKAEFYRPNLKIN